MSRGEGPLARWSRRKLAARDGTPRRGSATPVPGSLAPAAGDAAAAPEPAAPVPDVAPAPADGALPEQPADDGPALPAVEELTADSDYTAFLQEGVPEQVARAALRKLWRSDPVFANLDGLNDYDEDFNLIDRLIDLADTDYKVGRGFGGDVESGSDGEPATEAADADADAHDSEDQEGGAPTAEAAAPTDAAPAPEVDAEDGGEGAAPTRDPESRDLT